MLLSGTSLFLTGVELIYNVVLVSAVQQRDSVIHIFLIFFIFFSITVSYSYPLRDIEYNSL